MEFRGAYDSSVTYNVGDVVKYGGIWYHLQKAAPAGTAPVDTLYWSRLSGVVAEAAELVDDAVNGVSSEINEAKEAAEEAAASAAAAYGTDLLADDYSTSGTYAVGDYVIHSGGLYRCTTAIASGETWTDAHWAEVAIADDVSSINSEINLIRNAIGDDNLLPIMDGHTEWPDVRGGVSYTYDAKSDSYIINGTSSGTSSYVFLASASDVPAYIKPGGNYILKFRTTNENIYLQGLYYVSGNWEYVAYTKDTILKIPDAATDVGFRLYVSTSGKVFSSDVVNVSLKSVGDGDLTEDMDLLKLCGLYPYTSTSTTNATWTYDASTDSFTVSHLTTGASSFSLLGTAGDVPFFFKPGGTYYLNYTTGDQNVKFQFMYQVGSTWTYVNYTDDSIIKIPENASDVGFRLRIEGDTPTFSNVSVKASINPVSNKKYINDIVASATSADTVFEMYTDFEKNDGWWLADGTLDSGTNHKHTQKLAIRPNTRYFTGYKVDGYSCFGEFYNASGDRLSILTSEMITEYQYKIPDAAGDVSTSSYTKMYQFVSPADAAYLSFNFSILASGNNYAYRNFISSKPIFATALYGDLIIKAGDPIWNKFSKRKLCIIGTSQIMIDRLSRTGKFDGPDSTDATQYISGVQEYLMPWWDTVDSYGYSSAPMMYENDESPKSIYTRVVTDELDLSGYDDYFITHSTSGLTSDNIGELTDYSDTGSNTTFIGALRQIIDYIYTLNPKANVFVQTRIIRSLYSDSDRYTIACAANEKIRELAKMLSLTCVDTAEESGFNYYTSPYWCYDANGHPNQVGNYYIGMAMRKTLLGV